MKKVLLFIGLGIVVVVGAIVATLFISGRVALVMKAPADKVYLYQKVCSDETNSKFVEKFKYGQIQADPITEFVKDVKNKDGWKLDPNCVHIVMQSAIADGDTGEAKELAAIKQDLESRGLYSAFDVSMVGVSAKNAEEAAEQRKMGDVQPVGM